ncbi:MAG: isoaspartyl peptidase/L-asparaginase [Desulfovibrio sp.]|jgi:beta-aspartyl-peptidase (threonine type)|nr:isoaspartyl peptidase/L-asparaginase [Desulfovibrio sp.]
MSDPVLAIHGGAGAVSRAALTPDAARDYEENLRRIATSAYAALAGGVGAVEAVTLAVAMLEDCPLFNAGRGAVYTSKATHEMDAAIMDGRTLAAGAVTCVHGVKNPVRAARAVMERSNHVLLAGEGGMEFLRGLGVAFEPEEYFHSEQRYAQLLAARAKDPLRMVLDHDGTAWPAQSHAPAAHPDDKGRMGTVGAVARDRSNALAAATSTGGLTNKLPGRVGDTPLIGAGCYADAVAAVSCTGVGEYFIRLCVGHDIAARMRYQGASLAEAGRAVLDNLTALGGSGGFIAVDKEGNLILPFNTESMYRAWIGTDGACQTAIHGEG